MYIMDWRSKEEYCVVGYYPGGDRKAVGKPVVDNYAAVINEKGGNITPVSQVDWDSKLDELQKTAEPETPTLQDDDKVKSKVEKAKNMMNLDEIPEDYEAQFWDKV